jgi:hypothetical protein
MNEMRLPEIIKYEIGVSFDGGERCGLAGHS